MGEKTVTLSDQDWQQLTAIIANATGYLAFQRLVQQLQAQEMPKGDGRDTSADLPESLRRVPRA